MSQRWHPILGLPVNLAASEFSTPILDALIIIIVWDDRFLVRILVHIERLTTQPMMLRPW